MLDFQNNGFTRIEVMKNILNWHTLWLEEQKKQDKAPPVYGKYKINIKTNVFSGEQYSFFRNTRFKLDEMAQRNVQNLQGIQIGGKIKEHKMKNEK